MALLAQLRTNLSTEWQQQGACRSVDTDIFFPPSTFEPKDVREAREQQAKDVCASCIVLTECREWSLAIREPHGVWGGLTEAERRRAIATRAKAS